MAFLMAQVPSKQALSPLREATAAPEFAQSFPSIPDGIWTSPFAAAPETRTDEPVFGPEGPRLPALPKAETAEPKAQKNSRPGKAKADDKAGAAKAEALKKAMAPHSSHAALRGQMLDVLFKRLSAAENPEEARAVAAVIEKIWAQSDSDTAGLLMEHAAAAMLTRQYPLALQFFDKIILLQPTWAEAWNKRATLRFLADDLDGAMADIKQVLQLEPRHFGALAGAGVILRKEGFDKSALVAFRKSLEINPQQPELRSIVDKLEVEVEGRGI
jgi:tetratricopeptide (TPR) repeat protein